MEHNCSFKSQRPYTIYGNAVISLKEIDTQLGVCFTIQGKRHRCSLSKNTVLWMRPKFTLWKTALWFVAPVFCLPQ